MKISRFWQNFFLVYGAIWAVLMAVALVTQSHINTGTFGLYGFPLIAIGYALYQRDKKTPEEHELEQLRLENENLKDLVRMLKKEQDGNDQVV
jgi:hypothetical protein